MMPIVFEEEAREEYREAIGYYYRIDPDLQAGFRAEIGHNLRFIEGIVERIEIKKDRPEIEITFSSSAPSEDMTTNQQNLRLESY
jgi:hypothetical protein